MTHSKRRRVAEVLLQQAGRDVRQLNAQDLVQVSS